MANYEDNKIVDYESNTSLYEMDVKKDKKHIVKEVLFWVFFPIVFLLLSAILIFYMDLTNGPLIFFILMLLLLITLAVLRIIFRKKKWYIGVATWIGFIVLSTLILDFAKPGLEYKPAVLNANPEKTEVLSLKDGKVQGVYNEDKSVMVYAGIPYAKAPIGDLRWKEPQDVEPWNDVLDCSYFRAKSMQKTEDPVTNNLVDIYAQKSWHPNYLEQKIEISSEDSLYVNIWKPNTTETNLPVLVYIHGGSLTTGSPSFYAYNGENMAKNGIIQVNISYRLGVFGYLALEELQNESPNHTTGNYGLLDQIKALEWVNKNIESFGGNKNNITIAGESAGSSSVSAICASPLAKGLFQKAIGESSSVVLSTPPHTFRTLESAKAIGRSVLAEFSCKNVSELRKISADELVKTKSTNSSMTVDGYALPKTPYQLYLDGEASDVPLLNGFNSMEADAFTVPTYLTSGQPNVSNSKARLIAEFNDEAIVNKMMATQSWNNDEEAFRSFNNIIATYWFAHPHYSWNKAIKENYSSPVYTYYFDKENGYYSGYHSGELTYVFNTLGRNKNLSFAYDESDYTLAKTMNSAWAAFIKTGNPSTSSLTWEEWDKDQTNVMHFGSTVEMMKDKYSDLYKIFEEYYSKASV